jgi:hypothetical protein
LGGQVREIAKTQYKEELRNQHVYDIGFSFCSVKARMLGSREWVVCCLLFVVADNKIKKDKL